MTSPELHPIFLSMLCGCIVYTSFTIIVHSMAFWAGPIDSLSRKYCDALFLFALYPTNIYSGFLQVIMFTLIPAGVIGNTFPSNWCAAFMINFNDAGERLRLPGRGSVGLSPRLKALCLTSRRSQPVENSDNGSPEICFDPLCPILLTLASSVFRLLQLRFHTSMR